MRRIVALFVIPLIAGLALAGCGSSAPSSPNASVTAKGSFGALPSITIPKQQPTSTLAVKTLIQGNGATIKKSDLFLSNFTIYKWSGTTNKLLDSTYSSSPQVLPAIAAARHPERRDRERSSAAGYWPSSRRNRATARAAIPSWV